LQTDSIYAQAGRLLKAGQAGKPIEWRRWTPEDERG
jgi:hypothetical protein